MSAISELCICTARNLNYSLPDGFIEAVEQEVSDLGREYKPGEGLRNPDRVFDTALIDILERHFQALGPRHG